MLVVNLFGGPGAGKSTIAAAVFAALKRKHINTELVTEFIKDYVYDGTYEQYSPNQEWIFANQHQRLRRLRGKVDVAVTDSPLLLTLLYGDKTVASRDALDTLVKATHDMYQNFNVVLIRTDAFQQEGRAHDHSESIQLDQQLHRILFVNQIPFMELQVGENVVDIIVEEVTRLTNQS